MTTTKLSAQLDADDADFLPEANYGLDLYYESVRGNGTRRIHLSCEAEEVLLALLQERKEAREAEGV